MRKRSPPIKRQTLQANSSGDLFACGDYHDESHVSVKGEDNEIQEKASVGHTLD